MPLSTHNISSHVIFFGVNIALQKKLFFVVGDSCVTQDLSEDTILPPATRISHSIFQHLNLIHSQHLALIHILLIIFLLWYLFSGGNMDLQRVGFQPGPVHPSVFDIPSACLYVHNSFIFSSLDFLASLKTTGSEDSHRVSPKSISSFTPLVLLYL